MLYTITQRGGVGGGGGGRGGGRCQTFPFSFLPSSTDHDRDWPPCNIVFFGLATNALNVRNNNNNNNRRSRCIQIFLQQQQHGSSDIHYKGCKYKATTWYLNGFPTGSNLGSRV